MTSIVRKQRDESRHSTGFFLLVFSFFSFSFFLLILSGPPWGGVIDAVPPLLKLSVNNLTDKPVGRCVPYVT